MSEPIKKIQPMKKVHCSVNYYGYWKDKGIVCNTPCDDPQSTSIDEKITCEKCLNILYPFWRK